MKNYVSPVILDNEELAEGVYATGSGGSSETCFTNKTKWDRIEGTNDWTITVKAKHDATHTTEGLVLVLYFNTTVTLKSFEGGSLDTGSSDTGNSLRIRYSVHYDQMGVQTFNIVVTSPYSIHVDTLVVCDAAKGI